MFVKQYVSNQCRLEDLSHWLGCVVRDYEIKIVVRNHEHSSTVSIWNRLNFLNLTTIDPYYVQFAWPTELLQSVPSMHNNQRNNLYHHIQLVCQSRILSRKRLLQNCRSCKKNGSFSFTKCSLCFKRSMIRLYWKLEHWSLPSIWYAFDLHIFQFFYLET